ncbi:hypothetical protein HPB49_014999 [Dermacentor silvarum]|uniref:Uncharacterized protein n=1 Tax=Dermacentor silvarum TaxID=543639 RepID=A0ACB8CFT3_DERSI|nr:hypothetical protein HPB49_014999 [Dermacentor silvarum]
MNSSEKPQSPEIGATGKPSLIRAKKRPAAKGSKEELEAPGSGAPEEHQRNACSTLKSVSSKSPEQNPHLTAMPRKLAPKAAPSAAADASGQAHEEQEPSRSHIDKSVASGKAASRSGGPSRKRPRKRRKSTAASSTMAMMMKAATNLVKTKTPGETLADKRAEVLKNTDHEEGESGHSELDSQQQHCLALAGALGCTVLLFIVLTMAVYFSKGKGINSRASVYSDLLSCWRVHGVEQVACSTPECSAARKFMDDLLDSRQDRCKDFYRYVCHRWQEKGSSFARDQQDALLVTLGQKLAEYSKPPDPLGGYVVANVYRGCHTYLDSRDNIDAALSFTEDKVMSGPMREDTVGAIIAADRGVEAALEPRSSGAAAAPISTGFRIVTGPLSTFVDNLVHGMNAQAWVDALNAALPEKYRIDARANVSTVAWASFRSAFAALVSGGVASTAFYLGANLDAEIAYLETSRDRLKTAGDAKKAQFCLEQCRRIHSLAWKSLVGELLQDEGLADGAAVATEMFATLAHTVKDQSTLTWLSKDARDKALQLAFDTHIEVINAKRVSENSIDMTQFEIPAMDTAQAFVLGLLKIMELDLQQAPPTHRDVVYQFLEPLGPVSYEGNLDSILVPSLYLKDPYLYPHGVPMYYNYGTLGTQLGTAIAHAMNKDPGASAASGVQSKPSPLWTEETRERYNRSVQCLESLRQRMGFESGSEARGGEQGTLFTWVQGVNLAYHAVMKRFSELAEREDDAVLYMHNAQRTFFSRSCLLWCTSDSTGGRLSAQERCMLPLHNMREFADAFGCTGRQDFVQGECEA